MDNTIKTKLINDFRKARARLVLLDYDGTLVSFKTLPYLALPDKFVSEILMKLINLPHTDTYIITGRSNVDIDNLLSEIPINLIAEHGAMIKNNGIWENQSDDPVLWKKNILPVMNHIASTCPGSYIENKSHSITWHYRNSDPATGFNLSRKLISLLDGMITDHELKIFDGNKVVDVMKPDIGKGIAVKKLIAQKDYDFILSIGDDATDEEMFGFLCSVKNTYTIKVGPGPTSARNKLNNPSDVIQLLNDLI